VLLLAACGRVEFDALGNVRSGDGGISNSGSNGDSGLLGSSSSGCVSPGIGDSFDEVMPCSGWGSAFNAGGSLSTSNGELTLASNDPATALVGCQRNNVPFGPAGVFVQVAEIPVSGALLLELEDTTTGSSWGINSLNATEIQTQSGGTEATVATWVPAATSWWRMRPLGGALIYELSGDATTWTMVGTSTLAVPTTVTAAIEMVVGSGANTAVIDGIDVCP
jgi:hypothetical protein